MRFIFYSLAGYILTSNTYIQAVASDSLDNESNFFFSSNDPSSNLDINPSLSNDDLWTSDATTFMNADNNGLLFDDNTFNLIASCSPPSNTDSSMLNRRDGAASCPSPLKPPTDSDVEPQTPADVKFRPPGKTKDTPLLFPTYNPEICDPQTMGRYRTIVACDSSREEDRKPTDDAGVYVLEHCTPCMFFFCYIFYWWEKAFLILRTDDILAGCYVPHQIWCCHDLTPEIEPDELVSSSANQIHLHSLLSPSTSH